MCRTASTSRTGRGPGWSARRSEKPGRSSACGRSGGCRELAIVPASGRDRSLPKTSLAQQLAGDPRGLDEPQEQSRRAAGGAQKRQGSSAKSRPSGSASRRTWVGRAAPPMGRPAVCGTIRPRHARAREVHDPHTRPRRTRGRVHSSVLAVWSSLRAHATGWGVPSQSFPGGHFARAPPCSCARATRCRPRASELHRLLIGRGVTVGVDDLAPAALGRDTGHRFESPGLERGSARRR